MDEPWKHYGGWKESKQANLETESRQVAAGEQGQGEMGINC